MVLDNSFYNLAESIFWILMIYVPYRDVDSVGVLQRTSTSAGPQHTRLLQLQHSGWMAGRHQNGPVQRELCQWRPHYLWSRVSDDYGVCFRYLPYSSTDSHRSFALLSYRTRCYSHQKSITVNLIDSLVCLDHSLTVTLCSRFSDTLCLSSQWHSEGGSHTSRPPEEDSQQCADDASPNEPDPVSGGLIHKSGGWDRPVHTRPLWTFSQKDVPLSEPCVQSPAVVTFSGNDQEQIPARPLWSRNSTSTLKASCSLCNGQNYP